MSGVDQYFTCEKVAERMVSWAEIRRGCRVLEPSAGSGTIVRAIPKNATVTAIEIDADLATPLSELKRKRPGLDVVCQDFLKYRPSRDAHDVAIMNPPYSDGADGKHVAHALQFAPRVVCLVRANFLWGLGRYNQVFRWSQLTRAAILVRRPHFSGPADKGHTARHDFAVLELIRRDSEELDRWKAQNETDDRVDFEWWADTWG